MHVRRTLRVEPEERDAMEVDVGDGGGVFISFFSGIGGHELNVMEVTRFKVSSLQWIDFDQF